MNLIYFADGPWAHEAFDQIRQRAFKIKLVILRYDSRDPVLIEKAKANGIEVTWHKNINAPEFLDYLRSLDADLGVSMSFNQIFKSEILGLFPKGLINCHAGKLPLYRGRNILNWALINGEKEIGVTCHYVDEGIDTGDVILQQMIPVTMQDNYATLLEKSYKKCAGVLVESISLIEKGQVNRTPQPEQGTYFIQRKEGDEFIDWNWSSQRIFDFVRAICDPGPKAQTWLKVNGTHRLVRINKAGLIDGALPYFCIPGGVVGTSEEGNPLVKTGDSILELQEYTIDSSRKKNLKIGDRLGINYNLEMLHNYQEEEE